MVNSSRKDQWTGLELSSFQLETVDAFQAQVGVCMNVTPDHLDRHHTFESYANAKGRLFDSLQGDSLAVLNADEATCSAYASRTHVPTVGLRSSRKLSPGRRLAPDMLLIDGEELIGAA